MDNPNSVTEELLQKFNEGIDKLAKELNVNPVLELSYKKDAIKPIITLIPVKAEVPAEPVAESVSQETPVAEEVAVETPLEAPEEPTVESQPEPVAEPQVQPTEQPQEVVASE